MLLPGRGPLSRWRGGTVSGVSETFGLDLIVQRGTLRPGVRQGWPQATRAPYPFPEGLQEISGINPMQTLHPQGNSTFPTWVKEFQDASALPHFTDGRVEAQWVWDVKPLPLPAPSLVTEVSEPRRAVWRGVPTHP